MVLTHERLSCGFPLQLEAAFADLSSQQAVEEAEAAAAALAAAAAAAGRRS